MGKVTTCVTQQCNFQRCPAAQYFWCSNTSRTGCCLDHCRPVCQVTLRLGLLVAGSPWRWCPLGSSLWQREGRLRWEAPVSPLVLICQGWNTPEASGVALQAFHAVVTFRFYDPLNLTLFAVTQKWYLPLCWVKAAKPSENQFRGGMWRLFLDHVTSFSAFRGAWE